MRIVLDTSVLVAAIRSDLGASRRLLEGALRRQFTLLASTSLLIEYEAVMTRPAHLDAAALTADEVGRLIDAVAAVAVPVRFSFHWRPLLRDPDDDMVLETATNGGANTVVTFNVRDFAEGTAQFGIDVLTPGQAIQRLELRP